MKKNTKRGLILTAGAICVTPVVSTFSGMAIAAGVLYFVDEFAIKHIKN